MRGFNYIYIYLGIKNIHLWAFLPDITPLNTNNNINSNSNSNVSNSPQWICLLDVQTNGITLEYMAFTKGLYILYN